MTLVEQLRDYHAKFGAKVASRAADRIEELEQLRTRVAELEADAARLDWMDRNNELYGIHVDSDCYWYIYRKGAKSSTGYPFIRGAIDMAMKGQ